MALLEEEPIDIPNNAEDIGNNAEEIHDDKENEPNNAQESVAERAAEPTPVAKRKPGRPPGSKNRLQGMPRKPRVKKVEVIEEPIEEEMARPSHEALFEDPVEEEPQYQCIPTVATTSKEERMLRLLSDHAKSRRSRKVALWKSWF